MRGARPDILVVVLDCVRADSWGGGSGPRLPFLDRLRRSSVVWTRAATVAPWTLPSHATLFTGLPPWEHGCHHRGTRVLDPAVPRLTEDLAAAGYRSVSVSANPHVSVASGLARGFHRAAWGNWYERIRPANRSGQPPNETSNTSRGPGPPIVGGYRAGLAALGAVVAYRHPWTLDTGAALANRLQGVDAGRPPGTWVEPTLARYLAEIPRSAPAFAFVNLLDAHEPYLGSSEVDRATRRRLRHIPQDLLGYVAGRHRVSQEDLSDLRTDYDRQVGHLDERLRSIVDVWDQARGLDDSWVFVLSDHGQAFGEEGLMFHTIGPDEPHLRIPLLVRAPGGQAGGRSCDAWVSLLDVPRTIRHVALPGSDPSVAGRTLDPEHPPQGPVCAATDGLPSGFLFDGFIHPSVREDLDRAYGIVYDGDWKFVVDERSERSAAYDLKRDPSAHTNRWNDRPPELERSGRLAQEIAARMRTPHRPPERTSERAVP